MKHVLRLAALIALLVLPAAATAQADVTSGSVSDPQGDARGPAGSPRPWDLKTFGLRYDAAAGRLDATIELYPDDAAPAPADFVLRAGLGTWDAAAQRCSAPAATLPGAPVTGGAPGGAALYFYEGAGVPHTDATLAGGGTLHVEVPAGSYTISDPVFAGRRYDCVSGIALTGEGGALVADTAKAFCLSASGTARCPKRPARRGRSAPARGR